MGNRATRLLCVLGLTLAAAACGDDGGSSPDAAPCVPVNDNNECTTDACQNGVPVNTPLAAGTACATGACNATGMCVAPTCDDGITNGNETDVDCGGSCVATGMRCDDTDTCAVPADCTSGVCTATTCTAARCGDGVMQGAEMCDDGNDTNGDGCDDGAGDACRATGCGNGVVSGTEVCDDGNATNGDGCDNNCTPSSCGNGVIAGAETCDDGGTTSGNGCSATCAVESGYACTGMPSVCATTCGDGVIAGAEVCDDGGTTSGNGCSATCTVEAGFTCSGMPSVCAPIQVCGNGIREGTEACDQGGGNVADGDGCSSTCAVETNFTCTGTPSVCTTPCGNGITTPPETCDDSNTVVGDGCGATCRIEPTEVEPNEDGTPQTGGSLIAGNDFDVAGGIAVMNANTNGATNLINGNTAILAALATAGDEDVFAVTNGTTQPQSLRLDVWNRAATFGFGVACATSIDMGINIRSAAGAILASNDDRNGAADRCPGLDFAMLPGTTVYVHVVAFGDNTAIPGYGLQLRPTPVVCGDGVTTAGVETCDDGGTVNGDGCSSVCALETGYGCVGNPSVCSGTCGDGVTVGGNVCDDGNTANGDLCDSSCGTETLVTEVEPNGNSAEADAAAIAISASTIISGAIPANGDLDRYRLTVATAGVWHFETFDSSANNCVGGMTTTLRLFGADGTTQLYTDNVSGIASCSALTLNLAAGTYYLQVEETGNNAIIAAYRLQVQQQLDRGAESEPNETNPTADTNIGPRASVYVFGGHLVNADLDTYAVYVPAGKSLRAEIIEGGAETCELNDVDSRLRLLGPTGTDLGNDDDDGRGFCSQIDGTGATVTALDTFARALAGGIYYVRVEASSPTGTTTAGQFDYRLIVTIR